MKYDIGLLILRVGVGATMFFSHGLPKLMNFGQLSQTFPDPIGLGSMLSVLLAVFAEVFCSLALVAGAFTRFAAIPLVVTMATALLIVHGGDPWSKRELAFMFLVPCLSLFFLGGGSLSVDGLMGRRNR